MWLRRPEWRVLCASYALDLAVRDSVRCRELIADPWYQTTFRPAWSLSRSQNAKTRFRNTRGGERMCLSVGSRTTGFRGDCIIIDDPLNFADALSDTKRPKVNVWIDQALSNRLNDLLTGTMIMIMQRLHHDDASGHVLAQGDYTHLCLPSRFEPERRCETPIGWRDPRTQKGEPLFPALFPNEILDQEERRMGSLPFAGQHQQNPTPESGEIFERAMFCRDAAGQEFWPYPDGRITQAYLSFDTALKTSNHNDFTAGCVAMKCEDGFIYLYPLVLARLKGPENEKRISLLWAQWSQKLGAALEGCLIEEGAGSTIIQYLDIHNIVRKNPTPPSSRWSEAEWQLLRSAVPVRVIGYSPQEQGDKEERAHRVLPMLANGQMRLVDSQLSRAWLEQFLQFPLGSHDDAVDATTAALGRFILSPNSFSAGQRGMNLDACEMTDEEYDRLFGQS